MKKKISVFLCAAAALFFGSCADLSMDDEEAVKADLPVDFKWEEYGEINNDVIVSQIIFDVREKNKEYGKGADSTSKAVSNCVEILKDEEFAKEVYLKYMKCPEQGWSPNEKCSGIYANNGSYTKINGSDTTCVIDGCWHGGWSELTVGWQDSLAAYSGTVKAMCQFIPKAENLAAAQDYLKNFVYNSYLVEQHYHFFGRSDGRAYKHCAAGHIGAEKTQSLAQRREGRVSYYYDYGRYTFCLNEDQKIYVVK